MKDKTERSVKFTGILWFTHKPVNNKWKRWAKLKLPHCQLLSSNIWEMT